MCGAQNQRQRCLSADRADKEKVVHPVTEQWPLVANGMALEHTVLHEISQAQKAEHHERGAGQDEGGNTG